MPHTSWKTALYGVLLSSSIVTGLFYLYTWSVGL